MDQPPAFKQLIGCSRDLVVHLVLRCLDGLLHLSSLRVQVVIGFELVMCSNCDFVAIRCLLYSFLLPSKVSCQSFLLCVLNPLINLLS